MRLCGDPGRLDVMHVGLSSVIKLNRAGSDLRLIASLANVNRLSLFVAPGVTNPAGLKGGVLAVSTFGSESDTTATLALQRLGLTRDDVPSLLLWPSCFGRGLPRPRI